MLTVEQMQYYNHMLKKKYHKDIWPCALFVCVKLNILAKESKLNISNKAWFYIKFTVGSIFLNKVQFMKQSKPF